jgi:hypothetical protein
VKLLSKCVRAALKEVATNYKFNPDGKIASDRVNKELSIKRNA